MKTSGGRTPPPPWLALGAYALAIAVLLTLCDWAGHVVWDTLVYREPNMGSLLPGQPTLRVFAGFVALAVPLTLVAWWGFRAFPPPPPRIAVLLLITFTGAYLLSGALDAYPMVLVAGLMLLWAAQLSWFSANTYAVVVFSVVLAVVGPIAEGLYASGGFFFYADAAVFGVPAWLGPLYLNGALAVVASVATLGTWLGRGRQEAHES